MERSIDAGAVIRRVFEIYVDQAPVLMPAAAVVVLITVLFDAALQAASPGLALLTVVITLVGTTLFTGMIVGLVADLQDGRRDASVGRLLRSVLPVLGQLILVGFVAALAEGVGFVLLIVPGLILITIWAVFAPVVVLERPAGLRALGRSRELVRGNGWPVFGVIFVLIVAVTIVASGLELAGDAAGTGVGLVVRVVIGVLTAPLAALAAAVLYFELRGAATDAAQPMQSVVP